MKKTIENWVDLCGMNEQDIPMQFEVYGSELIEVISGIAEKNHQEIMDGVADSHWMINTIKYISKEKIDLSHQLDDLIEEVDKIYPQLVEKNFESFKKAVLESNYSKFCVNEKEVEQTREKYKEKGVLIKSKKIGEFYVIRSAKTVRGNDGKMYPQDKILKGIDYFEPQIKVK